MPAAKPPQAKAAGVACMDQQVGSLKQHLQKECIDQRLSPLMQRPQVSRAPPSTEATIIQWPQGSWALLSGSLVRQSQASQALLSCRAPSCSIASE